VTRNSLFAAVCLPICLLAAGVAWSQQPFLTDQQWSALREEAGGMH
jgi:hypothetical protein